MPPQVQLGYSPGIYHPLPQYGNPVFLFSISLQTHVCTTGINFLRLCSSKTIIDLSTWYVGLLEVDIVQRPSPSVFTFYELFVCGCIFMRRHNFRKILHVFPVGC